MASKRGLSHKVFGSLQLTLATSNAYYAKTLPSYRQSLQQRRLRRGKVRNTKGLRVKIRPVRRAVAVNVHPRAPLSLRAPAPQPSINPRKRPASPVPCDPVDLTGEPPSKKLRPLTGTTAIDIRKLSLVPLLKRLQASFCSPTLIVLHHGRWVILKQRGPMSLDEPLSFPEDLITIKVPPGLRIGHTSK